VNGDKHTILLSCPSRSYNVWSGLALSSLQEGLPVGIGTLGAFQCAFPVLPALLSTFLFALSAACARQSVPASMLRRARP